MKKNIDISGNGLLTIIVFETIVLVMLRVFNVLLLPWWLIFLPYIGVGAVWTVGMITAIIVASVSMVHREIEKQKTREAIDTLKMVDLKVKEDLAGILNKEKDDESKS